MMRSFTPALQSVRRFAAVRAMSEIATRGQMFYRAPESTKLLNVTVNGKLLSVPSGRSILEACNQAGEYVPTLCYHPLLDPIGTCRVCAVEIKNKNGKLVPACVTAVEEGMVVETNTPAVEQTVRFNLQTLRARHPNQCMTCDVNGHCEFQNLVYRYGVEDPAPETTIHPIIRTAKGKTFEAYDASSPALIRDMDKCVMCYRCVRACDQLQGMNVLNMSMNQTNSRPIAETECINCGACVHVCPVGAITERPMLHEVMELLRKREKIVVVETAPAVRVAVAENLYMKPGSVSTGQMVTALKRMGFNYVFDTNFTADLTIMEEGTELLERVKNGGPFPMFTSCCPAWINVVEKRFPQLIPNLSSCKSPQAMLGALAKSFFAEKLGVPAEKIVVVSIMPCVAKKDEAQRPQLRDATDGKAPDVDYVLTTRELAHMIEINRIPFGSLPETDYDNPLGASTGAAILFGVTGGVMEAALRTAYEVATGKTLPKLDFESVRGLEGIREATVDINGLKVNVAIAHGMANVQALAAEAATGKSKYHFIEMMSCTGGCIGGAGNPKYGVNGADIIQERSKATYSVDEAMTLRKSHENQSVQQLYKDYLGKPLGSLSHNLLHTHYTDRSKNAPKDAPAPVHNSKHHGHGHH